MLKLIFYKKKSNSSSQFILKFLQRVNSLRTGIAKMLSEMIIVATASHRTGRDWPFGYGSFDVTNSIQFDFNLTSKWVKTHWKLYWINMMAVRPNKWCETNWKQRRLRLDQAAHLTSGLLININSVNDHGNTKSKSIMVSTQKVALSYLLFSLLLFPRLSSCEMNNPISCLLINIPGNVK